MRRVSPYLLSLLVFLLAVSVRLSYLYQIRGNPLFEMPIVDAETYVDQARAISGGEWLGDRPFWQAPLYPYFLAITYALFGEGYTIPRGIQMILGALSCVLLYRIGRRVLGEKIALLASGMACFYGPFLHFEGELLSPALEVFLDLTAVLLLLRAARAPRWTNWLISGAVLGLAALARANVLLFVPAAIAWAWKTAREHGGMGAWGVPPSPHPLLPALSFLLGLALTIAPVTVRNYLIGGDFVLISSNAGVNFYIGNNPEYDRTVEIRPGPEWEKLVDEPRAAGIEKPSQRSRYFLAKSWSFIRAHPVSYAGLLMKKLRLFWKGEEIRRNQDVYFLRDYSWILRLLMWKRGLAFPFGLIGPLGLVGMGLSLWHRRNVLLLLFVASYALSVVLFFVCARYRIPVIPFLLLFGAYALARWIEGLRARRYKALVISVSAFAVLLAGLNHRVGAMRPMEDPEIRFNLGRSYEQKGMYARAATEYAAAVRLAPQDIRARNNLATVYAARGMYDAALREYERALELRPDDPDLMYNLGTAYLRQGRYDRAILYYERIPKTFVDVALAKFNLGYAYMRVRRNTDAIAAYRRAIELDSTYAEAQYNLGYVYSSEGRYEEAIAAYRAALASRPDYPDAENNLGTLYAGQGMMDRAIEHFRRAIELQGDHIGAHHNLAIAYGEKGLNAKALEEYETVLRLQPERSDIRRAVMRLHASEERVESDER